MRLLKIAMLILGFITLASVMEKTARHSMKGGVYSEYRVNVRYVWNDGSKPWSVSDPVNQARSKDWRIEIPSAQARYRGYNISSDAIVSVEPVAGTTYECQNNFWCVTCTGEFIYSVDPSKILFQFNQNIITPPSGWLTDRRRATLYVYKY